MSGHFDVMMANVMNNGSKMKKNNMDTGYGARESRNMPSANKS